MCISRLAEPGLTRPRRAVVARRPWGLSRSGLRLRRVCDHPAPAGPWPVCPLPHEASWHTLRMRVSAKSDYALRALIEIAGRTDGTPVAADVVARAQGIPRGFLQAILADLRRADIVSSQRGSSGGWILARAADQISWRMSSAPWTARSSASTACAPSRCRTRARRISCSWCGSLLAAACARCSSPSRSKHWWLGIFPVLSWRAQTMKTRGYRTDHMATAAQAIVD